MISLYNYMKSKPTIITNKFKQSWLVMNQYTCHLTYQNWIIMTLHLMFSSYDIVWAINGFCENYVHILHITGIKESFLSMKHLDKWFDGCLVEMDTGWVFAKQSNGWNGIYKELTILSIVLLFVPRPSQETYWNQINSLLPSWFCCQQKHIWSRKV